MKIAAPHLRSVWLGTTGLVCLVLTGCRHNPQYVQRHPPAPPASSAEARNHPPARPVPPASLEEMRGKPVFTQTGTASWYGNNPHHKAADGSTYDQNGLTAAHRTLPMGSTARVTNLSTGEQVIVRITDRGPFSSGRILDLSMGAAKQIGVYRAGVAKVKVEAWAHTSADPAGKWCVQTGAFKSERDAQDLKAALLARYHGARVTEFAGPTGFWVRADPAAHGKAEASAMLDWIGKPDDVAAPYLVRLD